MTQQIDPAREPKATPRRPRITLAMEPSARTRIFTEAAVQRLRELGEVHTELLTGFGSAREREVLAGTNILVTGWGCPYLDEDVLDAAPHLRAVIHSGGSVKGHVDPIAWERGIAVSSQAATNAVPVAEFTVAVTVLANKAMLPLRDEFESQRGRVEKIADQRSGIGNFGKTVGIIGASKIGRIVISMLGSYHYDVLLYDPYVTAEEAARLGVEPVDLDDLMRRSDVVSVHAPDLPETFRMVDERRLLLMKPDATLINTARGRLVDTEALERVLDVHRIFAFLDVTHPDPLPPESTLYDRREVVLTPHIAGSLGVELERLADGAIDEVRRLVQGEDLTGIVRVDELATMA